MDNARVVIVEDELIAAEFLKEILVHEGVDVLAVVDSGKEAIQVCLKQKPDAVFMDIMLRDNISGSEAAVEISRHIDTQIIFVTAYSDPEMIDYAVESQAAGYLSKPYNETEIVATLRLALARREMKKDDKVTKDTVDTRESIDLVDGYTYSTRYHRLIRDGQEVEIGPKALKLIELLCRQPDITVSDEQIMLHVWGEIVNDRTLRSLLHRIRASTSESLIKNISGVGYMICSKQIEE
jgi:DNA-binding response OmpR family regulator